jgi:hypothetical protein
MVTTALMSDPAAISSALIGRTYPPADESAAVWARCAARPLARPLADRDTVWCTSG